MLFSVRASDGETIECVSHGTSERGPVLLIAPAMGVRAGFYSGFADHLAALGYQCIRFDLRGNGGHSVRRENGADWGYDLMVQRDFHALVEAVTARYPQRPRVLVGHSLGGQLGCLLAAAYPADLDGIILIGSCMVDWRGWGKLGGVKRWLQYIQIGIVTRLLGYFPGQKLGFAGNEPAGQMRDWVHSALTGRYAPQPSSIDYEAALQQVRLPILALTFASDSYAPLAACRRLLRKMPAAQVTQLDFSDHQMGKTALGHFNWAKHPDGVLPTLTQWLDKYFIS